VITLIIEAFPDIPDALAAAKILEAIDALIPHLEIETKPLYQESKKIEQQVKALRKQAEVLQTDSYKSMYH
jgi:predicted ATP-grasp superfamily ATP-dependent carboligase